MKLKIFQLCKYFVKFDKNWPIFSWIFTMNIHESGNENSGKFPWIFTQKYHNSNEYEFWFFLFELNWIFGKSQKTQFKFNRFESIRIKRNLGVTANTDLSHIIQIKNIWLLFTSLWPILSPMHYYPNEKDRGIDYGEKIIWIKQCPNNFYPFFTFILLIVTITYQFNN